MWGRHSNKYGATGFRDGDGTYWHSRGENGRYRELQLLEEGGVIRDLKRQQKFSLKAFGKHICFVVMDFTYKDGKRKVAEDFKSPPVLKRRDTRIIHNLFRANFPDYDLRISQRRKA